MGNSHLAPLLPQKQYVHKMNITEEWGEREREGRESMSSDRRNNDPDRSTVCKKHFHVGVQHDPRPHNMDVEVQGAQANHLSTGLD